MIKPVSVLLCALLLAAAQHLHAQDQDEGQVAAQPPSEQARGGSQPDGGPTIYPTLAAGLVEMGVPVIDVRSEAEIEETGTLADAEHIPHTDVDAIADFIGDDASRAVVLYCGSGRRVGLAIDALRERGFHGMVNAGGYEDLRQALEAENEG